MDNTLNIVMVNLLVPVLAGLVYLLMALETRRVSTIRKIMFGEIGYRKVTAAFLMFAAYFITRPLQNIIGPHPWPMIINSARQFFLMAVISPAIFVGILHWVPGHDKDTPRSAVIAAYIIGVLMAVVFILINRIAITGSKVLAVLGPVTIYDATWFAAGTRPGELMVVHLITQLVSPVGFLMLSAAYVRHSRHTYTMSRFYDLMPLKWRLLEAGLLVFAASLIVAGIAALVGQYYTYLWVIYFLGAIAAGLLELKSIKLPPKKTPKDLR